MLLELKQRKHIMAVAAGLLMSPYFFNAPVLNFCFVVHVFQLFDTNDF